MENHKNEKVTLAEKVNNLLLKNRKAILSLTAVVCCVILAVSLFFSISSKKKIKALASTEKIIFDLNKFKTDFNAEKEKAEAGEKKEETETEGKKEDTEETGKEKTEDIPEEIKVKEDEAVLELEKIIGANNNSYAAYLAASTIADIYFSRKDFQKALESYETAAKTIAGNYAEGSAYFNAGVCAEELGNKEMALDFYKKASAVKDFPLLPRVMFNEARVQEELKNIQSAIETYKKLSEKYPDNEWALIGKSRVIALEIELNKEM